MSSGSEILNCLKIITVFNLYMAIDSFAILGRFLRGCSVCTSNNVPQAEQTYQRNPEDIFLLPSQTTFTFTIDFSLRNPQQKWKVVPLTYIDIM
ncbi:hypothetical protein RRG08_044788 [Elysia crispata]|uniref:Uncharacterized protein n=1 Tax=Elysia crispata TaxID=231223 RepID=A0AAE0ZUF2_9GAST|nr:hypothetical protein RRG08_044788 [Elysia crispata]